MGTVSPPVIMRHLMAVISKSRNAFADPSLPTVADLIEWTKQDQRLSLVTARNRLWALKLLPRIDGKDKTDIPAHPEFIRMLLQRATPETLRISRPALNNARSLIGKALRWFGLASIPG